MKWLWKFLYLLFLKFINFKILELFIKYIKKVWNKFWNWIIRNIIFIVVIKVDSCKKKMKFLYLFCYVFFVRILFEYVFVKFDINECDWIKILKFVLDKII